MENFKVKEWFYRAKRTFIQAAIGSLSVNFMGYFASIDFDFSDPKAFKNALATAILSLVGSAFAAGIAAIMNMTKKEVAESLEEEYIFSTSDEETMDLKEEECDDD